MICLVNLFAWTLRIDHSVCLVNWRPCIIEERTHITIYVMNSNCCPTSSQCFESMQHEARIAVWVTSYLGLGLGQINWHKFSLFIHFITKLCYIHQSQKTTPVTRQWRKWKLTRRRLRGCEPGQDSQPPNPPKQRTKTKQNIPPQKKEVLQQKT